MSKPSPSPFSDAYFDMAPEALIERIKKESYFHDLDLPGIRTGSWVYGEKYPPNYHLWPVLRYLGELDLSGKVCLDIGTYDGMTAFVMAERGAERIDATCQFDLDRFRLARALCRYNTVAYHPNTDLDAIAKTFAAAHFDVVVISAMLHHLTSPIDAVMQARRLLKQEGIFILESIFLDRPDPALLLNTELNDPVYGAPTIFVPTLAALRGMLHFAAFEILSETRLLGGLSARETNYERVTFLARARRPSDISARTRKAAEVHAASPKLGPLDYAALDDESTLTPGPSYAGAPGSRVLNIWLDEVRSPLQPACKQDSSLATLFVKGRESRFLELAKSMPDAAFDWRDVYLLSARYSGETMPEGMTWGLKQFGNLHVLDYIKKLGLSEILEVGPGFNLYFVNHLPSWCNYVGLDARGFYDESVMDLANKARATVQTIDGLMGKTQGLISDATFDACISVSVLEHVPADDITSVCTDMFRVLKPGGWAIHSIDASFSNMDRTGITWLDALRDVGFRVEEKHTDTEFGGSDNLSGVPLLTEPLSIRARFTHGYRKSIWGDQNLSTKSTQWGTILVAAQKPR